MKENKEENELIFNWELLVEEKEEGKKKRKTSKNSDWNLQPKKFIYPKQTDINNGDFYNFYNFIGIYMAKKIN